jgi:ABC-type lipoprotein release transport system permease subunit
MPYGNPLAALADAWGPISKTLGIGLLIIIGICSFVMMGTIGKVIADSRKETSVFRAVGAKRMDIAQIYLLYTAILGTLSFGLAVLLGGAVALWFEATYSGTVSADAVLAFNTHDLHKTFHLIGFAPLDMAAIYLLALGVSLLGALLPLLTNVSRNPVKDMRAD